MDKPLRVGLAGLGTVGAAVVGLLSRHANELADRCGRAIQVTAVAARDRTKDRGFDVSGFTWHDDLSTLAADPDIDVFVELVGGESGAAAHAVRVALERGLPVVTANKALLAHDGNALARIADAKGVSIGFEAAVAGGIPIVRTLREALAANTVSRVYGILNGTCNYILTRMERDGLDFSACLAEAQRLGYAEADPTFDVEGFDTAHKLALLTALAFGTEIDAEAMHIEGIAQITPADIEAADELGYRIKLLGVASRTESGIEQRVHPTMVPKSSAIARIDGVLNAIAVDGDAVGEIVLVGPGAGGAPTASSVVADLADVAAGRTLPAFGRPADRLQPYRPARMRRHAGGYYVRLLVEDRPGAFATVAHRMAEHGISLESIVQRRRAPRADAPGAVEPAAAQPIILMTYETTEAAMRDALAAIAAEDVVAGSPRMIRIEKLA
jgi:homoserine dehydrogenase